MPTKTNPVLMILKDDHKKMKGLFEELKKLDRAEETFKAKFTVLGELVKASREGRCFRRRRRPRLIGKHSVRR